MKFFEKYIDGELRKLVVSEMFDTFLIGYYSNNKLVWSKGYKTPERCTIWFFRYAQKLKLIPSYLDWNNNILFNCEYLTVETECKCNKISECNYKSCPKILYNLVGE